MKLKLMEDAVMVHLKFKRNGIYDDMKEMDIAVEDTRDWSDDSIDQWVADLHETVQETYNQYHYWDEIEISMSILVRGLDNSIIREEIIRL